MSTYGADRRRIRDELMKLACAGEVTYYSVLGGIIDKHERWPRWKPILDDISRDEVEVKNKPDITFLVLNASTGWPGQIGFEPTRGQPTDQQKLFAQQKLDEVFAEYCPGKAAPKLPLRRRR
jgi:hypothetical protein